MSLENNASQKSVLFNPNSGVQLQERVREGEPELTETYRIAQLNHLFLNQEAQQAALARERLFEAFPYGPLDPDS